jgi:pyruvate dehydrogenase E1 component alpha subunit
MVWASSMQCPVVFFCQNNQFGISTPSTTQSRVPIAQRAAGFGFPGVRVDGNDVVAVYEVTKEALARARRGEGPTLIEAFTYRMGAHTTSDDPTRYRYDADVELWRHRDPIARLQALLSRAYDVDRAFFDAVRAEADDEAMRLREGVLAMEATTPLDMFDHVYAGADPFVSAAREDVIALGLAEPT